MGKLDEYEEYEPPLKGKYAGESYFLFRYYPEINSYAYIRTGDVGPGYGFIRDSAVEIMENSDE